VERFIHASMKIGGGTLFGRLAFTFLLTTRGTPLVYYGDEIALAGGNDPDNRRDFPGGFPGDSRDAFVAAGRTPDEQAVFERLRALLLLRRALPALRRGRLVNLQVDEQAWVYARVGEGAPVLVAINNGNQAAAVDAEAAAVGLADGAALQDRLGTLAKASVERGRLRLTLPPRSAAVLAP
jgi:glycosidase